LVTPDFPPSVGGIQEMLGKLAQGLAEKWEVTVIAPATAGSTDTEGDVPYAVKRSRTRWGGARSARALGEMAALGCSARPNVVLAAHLATLPAAVAASRPRHTAAILYGSELWSPKTRAILRLFWAWPRTYLAISRFTARMAIEGGIAAQRIRVVEPGASPPLLPQNGRQCFERLGLLDPSGDVVPFFVTIARLAEPHKGHDAVIRALPPLVARHPEVRYVVAGDGPLRGSLERLASVSGVEKSVLFVGRVDETTKGALLGGCRALVMPSREAPAAAQFEGFGIAFLEAALAGRPSIGGAAGAVPEVVIGGTTGLIVDPQNSTELLESMMRLMDPRFADELGEHARERAVAFTWSKTTATVDRTLRELL
jgi:phosphatidylinositol alpha-1,6-mannosyltransferase